MQSWGKCLMLGSAGMYIYIYIYTLYIIHIDIYIYIYTHAYADSIMLNINTSPTPCTLNHSIPLHPTRRRNRRRPQKLPSSRIPRGWDGEWWYNGDMMASTWNFNQEERCLLWDWNGMFKWDLLGISPTVWGYSGIYLDELVIQWG